MFRVITSHVPAPAGVASPLLWGTEAHLVELFGPAVGTIRSVERDCVWRFTSPEEFVTFFRRWYGPTLKAFEALDDDGRTALAEDLADLARQLRPQRRRRQHRDPGDLPRDRAHARLTVAAPRRRAWPILDPCVCCGV